jgi:rhodanese-related sulfurtransferase
MKKLQNCWEYWDCGREPGGKNTEMGICKAAVDEHFDGINGGKCAGRMCWTVPGTLCRGTHQSNTIEKYVTCQECPFFKEIYDLYIESRDNRPVVLKFQPCMFESPRKTENEFCRSFVLMAGETLTLQKLYPYEETNEYVYLIIGNISIASKDGLELVKEEFGGSRPFLISEKQMPLLIAANRDSIFYHMDCSVGMDRVIAWGDIYRILTDRFLNINIPLGKLMNSYIFRNMEFGHICEFFFRCEVMKMKAGDTLIEEGGAEDFFYVVLNGYGEVWIPELGERTPKKSYTLKPGDVFGEYSLITDKPSYATITMITDSIVLCLDKKSFRELLANPIIREVGSHEAQGMIKEDYKLIDIRWEEENEEVRIPGSIFIPINEIKNRYTELDASVPYIVYCRSGVRSKVASFLLNKLNFNTISLKGGIIEWPYEKEGLAVSS